MHIADSDLLVPPTSPICLKVLILGGGTIYIYIVYIYIFLPIISYKYMNYRNLQSEVLLQDLQLTGLKPGPRGSREKNKSSLQ